MTQADSNNTLDPSTDRIGFSSVNARRSTIAAGIHRETLLSQFPVSSRVRSICVTPPCQQAHRDLIASLAQLTPHDINGSYTADRFDIMARADHLKAVLAAVHAYAQVVVRDIAHFSPVNITDETGFISDAAHEINGALMKAVDQIIEDAAVAAE